MLDRILRREPGSSFSDLWYRVGETRPRLSVHTRVIRQSFGGHTVYVLDNPSTAQFYRTSEAAWFFIGLLDGERTVDAAWQACVTQLGDAAPTQRECVELLAQLQLYGMLLGEQPLTPDMIELRRAEARKTKIKSRTGLGFTLTLPLINPEPWLNRAKGLINAIFSRAGLIIWLLVVGVGLYHILTNLGRLASPLNTIIAPANLPLLAITFFFLRAIHELGHAAAVKAFGGRCTEIGMMIIALVIPFPYCDASAAWRFPRVRDRVVVSAGGVLFETFIAAIAAIVWAYTPDASVRTVCFNIMLVSGVSTLLFNLNPLLRYDGYYILSDLTGTANLYQRSRELWKFMFERHLFGVRGATPPAVRNAGEFWLMLAYGTFSFPYRLFITFAIVLILWHHPTLATVGLVLGVIGIVLWFVWPALKLVWYLATDSKLNGSRARAISISGSLLAAAVLLLAVVPMPAAAYATGQVTPRRLVSIRAAEPGVVAVVHAGVGDVVNAGDAVITLTNLEIEAEVKTARAAVDQARARLDAAAEAPMVERMLAQSRLDVAAAALQRAIDRQERLVLRSPIDGRLTVRGDQTLESLLGSSVPKGSMIAEIGSFDDLQVRCIVADDVHAYMLERRRPEDEAVIRLRGAAGRTVDAVIEREFPAGSSRIDQPALTTASGGEILLDPSDAQGRTALQPQFVIELRPLERTAAMQPGQRARVRFPVAPEPIAARWWRSILRTFGERPRA